MASSERGAAEAAQRIADAFATQQIPYAVGGALALAIAGVPRGTADVDINMMGEEDERVRRWDDIVRRFAQEAHR